MMNRVSRWILLSILVLASGGSALAGHFIASPIFSPATPLGTGSAEPAFTVKPSFGPAGREVLLTGEGIGASVADVLFELQPAASFRVLDQDHVAAVVPAGLPFGAVSIQVKHANGTTTTVTNAFTHMAEPDPSRFTRVLFPLAFAGGGAFGSQWTSENWIRNDSVIPLVTDMNVTIAPNRRRELPTFTTNRGLVVGIAREQIGDASFSSHVRDLSRSAIDAGTELRVVTEERAAAELKIVNVEVERNYRYMLRVYDIDSVNRNVQVRAVNRDGAVIGEATVPLRTFIVCVREPCITGEPAYGAIDLRDVVAEDAGDVDLLITAAGARLWAFVSATNNDTQHVTTYTPQP